MEFNLFSQPKMLYKQMLSDIQNAKKYIFLETYLFGNDPVGKKFLELMAKKAREGVKVRLLIDAWGFFYLHGRISKAKRILFKEFLDAGGELKFFRELRYTWRIFSDNHERLHRKLLVIDDKISYLGSFNIIYLFSKNREIALRIDGKISTKFRDSFLFFWNASEKKLRKKIKSLWHRKFKIIHDVPNKIKSNTEKNYVHLVNNARNEIKIETPYFVPSPKLLKALVRAVNRGVIVSIVIPKKSNWRILDLIRNKYLGYLHKRGIKVYYFLPTLLHSKLLIIDGKLFLLGSSNVDYRSFLNSFEINLLGEHKKLTHLLENHFAETLRYSEPFSYNDWKERSSAKKILEKILYRIRRWF